MNGRIYVVAGANSDLGKASALAQMNANVVMLCRDRKRGEASLAEIREQSGNQNVEFIIRN